MPSFEIISNQGVEEMDVNLKDMLSGFFGQQKKKRKMSVADAFEYLIQEEENKLIDMEQVTRIAVERAEQMGIILWMKSTRWPGANRATARTFPVKACSATFLPIIEGTTVNTRYGMIRTDHILFIAAGAFHVTKPSDLIPETAGPPADPRGNAVAEGRGLRPDSHRAENALIKQYIALLETRA